MKKLFAMLLAMVMVFSLAACGGDKEPSGNNDNPGTSQQGGQNDNQGNASSEKSIVNAANEAWVGNTTKVAYIFLDNGTYESYVKEDDGSWGTNGNGTYKLDKTSLTIDSTTSPVVVEDNTFIMTINGKEYVYTRTAPFNPGQSTEKKLDEGLVLADGKAWIWDNNGVISGYIFKADGTYSYHAGDEWTLQSSGTWSTSGGKIIFIYSVETTYTYVVTDGSLKFTTYFGDVYGPFVAQAIPSGN